MEGNLTNKTNHRGQTNYSYDALNRLIEQENPNFAVTSHSYGTNTIAKSTDSLLNETTYIYNGFEEVIQQQSPDTGFTIYNRNKNGEIVSITDAKGSVTDIYYDLLGRITSKIMSDDNVSVMSEGFEFGDDYVHFIYDMREV